MIKHAETLKLPFRSSEFQFISCPTYLMSKCSINVSVTGSRAKMFGHHLVLRELNVIKMYDKCETY